MIRIKNPIAPRLPNEYQEVEYLESTGTQHINTGFKPNGNTSIELEAKLTNITQTSFLYGGRSYANNVWSMYVGCVTQNSDYKVAFNYSIYDSGWKNISYNVKEKNTWYQNKNVLYMNGTKVDATTYTSFSTGSMPLYLFATSLNANLSTDSYNSSEKSDTRKAYAKIYTCKIWDDTTLVRNFVPCYRKSDNVAGMYDLVNNAFYTNAGTGVFLRGNEINKRDVNIKPILGDKPLIRRYAGDKLVYGREPSSYEQLVNYTMLYDNGDECTDITGGWLGANYYTNSVVTKYDKYIHLHSYRAMMYTKNKIDLSAYVGFGMFNNHLHFTDVSKTELYIQYSSTSDIRYGMFKEFDTNGWRQHILFWDRVSNTNNIYVPYSNLSNYYLGIYVGDGTCNAYMNVRNIALFRSDDWQTLANIAGITASSIDDILNNSTMLLSNKEAVDFMIYQCTGSFMASAVTNETFLTALNNSAYNTIIQANEHWNKFLSMVA